MKKVLLNKQPMKTIRLGLIILIASLFVTLTSFGQVRVPFTQRTSTLNGSRLIYNVKGDFTMIGNTNLYDPTYPLNGTNTVNNIDATDNNTTMAYVDVDGDPNTLNSSTAELKLSTENGADPNCSHIVYAGLYWTGRAHNGNSPNTFSVTKSVPGSVGTPINQNYTVSNTGTISGTTYHMDVSRQGNNNNNRYVRYTFSSSVNPQVLFEFQNTTPYIRYSMDNGINWTNASSQNVANNGNIRTVTFSPVTIYSETGGIVLTVNQLVRDSRNDQSESTYQGSAIASGNVSGTFYAPVSVTKNFNKQVVSLKGPNQSTYTQFIANSNDIYYPTSSDGYMYSAYAEVTQYVRDHGIGNYTVADIALNEGSGGGTGFYGGWGMIVIYENSKMTWRDVTVFDGHAYVASNGGPFPLPVSGFNTALTGAIDMKLGVMAGEGDRSLTGDSFSIQPHGTSSFTALTNGSPSASSDNFFDSSISTLPTGGSRNPNLVNNTGLDLHMFSVPNTGNVNITNNQTSTTFQYNTSQDTYII